MSEANKATARRFYDEFLNKGVLATSKSVPLLLRRDQGESSVVGLPEQVVVAFAAG